MILVTGGTGFVGSHLIYRLVANGNKVRAIKRENSSLDLVNRVFSRNHTENLLTNIEWIKADVLDLFSLLDAFEGVSHVYHAAATVSFEPAEKELMMRINKEGTANVVNAALEKKISKLCFVSSIAALGRASDNKLINEDTHFSSSVKPSVYSISKFEAEREVWRGIHEGLNAVIVNPSIILGAGDWNSGSTQLFKTVYNGLKFYTSGSNGFVDVNDVVVAMIKLMESDVSGEQFIVSAENISYRQLFNMIAEALKVPAPKYLAGKVLSNIYWRALKVHSAITRKQPLVTKESARTAQQLYLYDNSKLLKTIEFKYIPVNQTINETAEIFLKENTQPK